MESGKQYGNEEAPNAILTTDQRKYLAGLQEYEKSDSARWKMYSRIRNQLRWGIYDFALLYDNWDELNLNKAFDDGELHTLHTMDGLEGAIATLYRGLFASEIPFDKHLKNAVWKAEADMNNRNVDVRFDVSNRVKGGVYGNSVRDRLNPDDVRSLRIPELRYVVESLVHSDADIAELVKEGQRKQNQHYNDDE